MFRCLNTAILHVFLILHTTLLIGPTVFEPFTTLLLMFCSTVSVFQMIFQALFCIIRKSLVGYDLIKVNDTCTLGR